MQRPVLPTRRAVAAMALTAMALSCAEEGRPPPFPFGRPREFEPACPGETVEVDGSTLVWTSEVMRSATGWTATVRGERLRFQGLDEIGTGLGDHGTSMDRWVRSASSPSVPSGRGQRAK